MATHQYRPLNKDLKEIRVLYLEPTSHISPEAPVRCRLENVSLSDPHRHKYIAISYSWGKDPPLTDIELEGKPFKVYKTAEIALRGLYSRSLAWPKPDFTIPVWIDSICINQIDLVEKGHQVAMMKDVYSGAEKILAWLGPDTGAASEAVRSINVMYEECRRITDGFKRLVALSMTKDEKIVPEEPPASCDMYALLGFYGAEWFTRIWPIQEVVLAKDAIMIQGNEAINWAIVAIVARWVHGRLTVSDGYKKRLVQLSISDLKKELAKVSVSELEERKLNVSELDLEPADDGPSNWPKTARQGMRNCASTWQLKTDSKARQPYVLFNTSSYFDSTDPRDKVYAFYGILQTTGIPDDQLDYIKPVYESKTVSEVYAAATFLVFLNDRTLGQLQFATPWQSLLPPPPNKGIENGDCPSWTFKFSRLHSLEASYTKSHDIHRNLIQGVYAGAAVGPQHFRCQLRRAPHVLTVKGMLFTTISSTGEKLARTTMQRTQAISDWTGLAEELVNRWKPTGLDPSFIWNGDLLQQFGTAAVSGTYGNWHNARHVANNDNAGFLRDWGAFLLRCKESLGPVDPRLRVALQILGPEKGNSKPYLDAMELFGADRILFTTNPGYMGAGPLDTKPGDKVCLIFSCKVPLILRKEGENWRLVGQAYVCKIMNGEFVRKLKKQGKLEGFIRDFDIC